MEHDTDRERHLALHDRMFTRRIVLPTDDKDYGGEVVRWADGDDYPDCSCGCSFALWLKGALGGDWCVCTKPGAPREGLLTFEHQTGRGCFEIVKRKRARAAGVLVMEVGGDG